MILTFLRRYFKCLIYLIAKWRDSILEILFPDFLHENGTLFLSCSNDLFMSFILVLSLSQAVFL